MIGERLHIIIGRVSGIKEGLTICQSNQAVCLKLDGGRDQLLNPREAAVEVAAVAFHLIFNMVPMRKMRSNGAYTVYLSSKTLGGCINNN